MDDSDFGKIIGRIKGHLIHAYVKMVIKVLADLPLSIEAPPTVDLDDADNILQVSQSLIQANTLLSEIPMDTIHRESVRALVIDWLAAVDNLPHVGGFEDRWRLEFIVTQIQRIRSRWIQIEALRETLE